MPGKPPYYPYYPNDIEGDPIVKAMSCEQFGAYQHLLNAAWLDNPCGTIVDDDNSLANIARVPLKRWKQIRDGVLKAFTKGDDGRLHQKRMKHEFEKLQKRSKAGATPKQNRSKSEAFEKQNGSIPEAKVKHAFGYGSGDGSESCLGEGPGEREPPKPAPGQPPESQLAQIWLFFLKGPRSKATEINAVAEVMAELLRKGTPFEQIEARITDKSRDWSEPIWEFAKHWKPKGKLKPADPGFYDGIKAFANAGKDA